jgi:hypothetical protein
MQGLRYINEIQTQQIYLIQISVHLLQVGYMFRPDDHTQLKHARDLN